MAEWRWQSAKQLQSLDKLSIHHRACLEGRCGEDCEHDREAADKGAQDIV